jgi:hypothetical protein
MVGLYAALFFLKMRFWNAKSDPKFGQRGVVLYQCQKERFWNAVLACVLLRKNFWNGVPSQK